MDSRCTCTNYRKQYKIYPQVMDIMGMARFLAIPHTTGYVKHAYNNQM